MEAKTYSSLRSQFGAPSLALSCVNGGEREEVREGTIVPEQNDSGVRLGGSRDQANTHRVTLVHTITLVFSLAQAQLHMPQTTRHSPTLCWAQGTQPYEEGERRMGMVWGAF